jgi:predicted membrane channel-forming protein YqfA (hemolysin III family)
MQHHILKQHQHQLYALQDEPAKPAIYPIQNILSMKLILGPSSSNLGKQNSLQPVLGILFFYGTLGILNLSNNLYHTFK